MGCPIRHHTSLWKVVSHLGQVPHCIVDVGTPRVRRKVLFWLCLFLPAGSAGQYQRSGFHSQRGLSGQLDDMHSCSSVDNDGLIYVYTVQQENNPSWSPVYPKFSGWSTQLSLSLQTYPVTPPRSNNPTMPAFPKSPSKPKRCKPPIQH